MQEIVVKDPITGVQYRTNPCRDIAYFAPQLVNDLEQRLSREYLPKHQAAILDRDNLWDELKAAYAAFCSFWQLTLEPDNNSPKKTMEAAGFFKPHSYVQNLVLETFGKCCLGAAWAGMKSAYFLGETYPPYVHALKQRGLELVDELAERENTVHGDNQSCG